jgi:hypothetical protein
MQSSRYFYAALCAVGLMLGSCEQFGEHKETARQALSVFCTLKQVDIIRDALLTPEQQRAGAVVCSAVGMSLGTQ